MTELLNPADAVRAALPSWLELLGTDRVIDDPQSLDSHGRNAAGSANRAAAILCPRDLGEVQQLMKIAARFRAPLYPISTGRNWGYGAASPGVAGAAVVDLSGLRRLRLIDAELGIIAVEPGVTQQQLADFLVAQRLDLLVPVHGGGPDCSLLGNALERGYGLTPTTDHFAALTSLTAVLPDGTVYRSPFEALGAETIGAAHRWGIGPYLEGLFSQGNFGIVTEATLTLRRRPEHVEAFFVRVGDEPTLGAMADRLRDLLSSLGASIAGINLMNDRRVLSMSRPYPVDQVPAGEVIPEPLCREMTSQAGITSWTAAGVIHCPAALRRVIRRELRRLLPPGCSRPIHMNRRRVGWARTLLRYLPAGKGSILQQLDSIESLLDLADGIPRRIALPLAYWLRGDLPHASAKLDPAQDGCGLIWYSPLVPMKSATVIEYVRMVHRVCVAHGIEPLITLTSLSERLFDSTVPLLYRPEESGAADRARDCFQSLVSEGRRLGCLPYRLPVDQMQSFLSQEDGSHWGLVRTLKRAIDPHDVLAPGRYSFHSRQVR